MERTDRVILTNLCMIQVGSKVLVEEKIGGGAYGIIFPGGHVEEHEPVTDSVIREVREELNLELDEIRLQGVYSGPSYHHTYPNGDETSCIDIVYVCGRFHGDMRLQPEEVADVAWFDRAHLPQCLSGSCKKPIQDYFAHFTNLSDANSKG